MQDLCYLSIFHFLVVHNLNSAHQPPILARESSQLGMNIAICEFLDPLVEVSQI
jgi:hypothetical protein